MIVSSEVADLKQTEAFLLSHGLNSLPLIPIPINSSPLAGIARVWWRVRERRVGLEEASQCWLKSS